MYENLQETMINEWKDHLLAKLKNDTLSMVDHDTLTKLDTAITEIQLNAANHLKPKLRDPDMPWSPLLDQAYLECQY